MIKSPVTHQVMGQITIICQNTVAQVQVDYPTFPSVQNYFYHQVVRQVNHLVYQQVRNQILQDVVAKQ